MTRIDISRDSVWIASGRIDKDGEIVDCAPQCLGDETYEAIQEAIDSEPQDADRYTGTGAIQRPDGEYSWRISVDD